MNRITRNVMANAFGGVWAIVLNLLAIPIQIRILGSEAYGLIGFVTTVQVILVVFDLGLPTTIVRQVALDAEPDRAFSRSLVQTCSTIYWLVALIVGSGFALSADWIANHWLHVETLSPILVAQALRLLAVYITFTWPLNIYTSTLAGLQRFEIINLFKIINTSLTQLGGIVILLITHDLQLFILWLVLNTFVALILNVGICYRLLPGLTLKPYISLTVIRRVWKFSFDLNLISTFAIIYTQTDRILISALLPLRTLGYYNAASNVSRQISTVQEFINTAVMPTLSVKTGEQKRDELEKFYYQYAQVLTSILVLPTCILVFFGYDILQAWTNTDIAQHSAVTMGILAVGSLINGSMTTNYTLAVASGHSRIAVWVNIAALLVYIPVMTYLVTTFGMNGAAFGWVLLNLYYLSVFVPFSQHRILGSNIVAWLRQVLIPFAVAGILVFGLGWWLQQALALGHIWLVVCLGCGLVYTLAAFFLLKSSVRQHIIAILKQAYTSFAPARPDH
jgi:O-antigen/teichoic acid export membrane protein